MIAFSNRYKSLTTSNLYCKIQGNTIGNINATILTSENNGRSLADKKTFFVTPDEQIYNFQTFAGNN